MLFLRPIRYSRHGHIQAAAMRSSSAWRGATHDRRVERIFREWDVCGSPGCAVGVFSRGRFLYGRGFGVADLSRGDRLNVATPFVTGSLAKQFTALAVMLASEDGALSIDDAIRKYVPELPGHAEPITIRHLLQHTSGLRDYNGLMAIAGRSSSDVHDNAAVLRLAARQSRLNFQPGHEYMHSNSGYVVLAVAVERAVGTPFPVYARRRIFEPLGMDDTCFRVEATVASAGCATAYARDRRGFRLDTPSHRRYGAGGMATTVRDLLRWDENFYQPRVGRASILRQMETPGRLADGRALDYGFGMRITQYGGARLVSHIGADGGYRAFYGRLPEQELGVACLTNLGDMDTVALSLAVLDVFLEVREAQASSAEYFGAGVRQLPTDVRAVQVPHEQLVALEGDYWSEELEATFAIRAIDGELRLIVNQQARVLTPVSIGAHTYQNGELTIVFEIADDGQSSRLRASVGRVRALVFTKRPARSPGRRASLAAT